MIHRWWVSWYSGNYADEGCTAPPFQFWDSGHRFRPMKRNAVGEFEDNPRDDMTICAVIDAEWEREIWEVVAKHFPDYEKRFCDITEPGWVPGDRFPDFEGRTSLYAPTA